MDTWRDKALFRVVVIVAVSASFVGALLFVAGLCAATCNKNNDPLVEDPEVIELGPCSAQVRSASISISTHHDDGFYLPRGLVESLRWRRARQMPRPWRT